MSFELELKFQVPPARAAALRRAVATASAQATRLQARYFDTDARTLAEAGLALRLRREGSGRGAVWVQTLKGAAAKGALARSEHNVTVPGVRVGVDPARHHGTPAGDRLAALLPDAAALGERFATDIHRVHRRVRAGAGTVVELAFDSGRIVAGDAALAVCELEIELVSGGLPALLALARRWVPRHALWLDVRTKAERGDALARSEAVPPAVHARPLRLPAGIDAASGVRAMLAAALDQALPNAAALAQGLGQAEHVHQLRVALRRLRTALRLFGDAVAVPPALLQALGDVFGRLGAARDRDVLAEGLLPQIVQAGGPPFDLPTGDAVDVGAVLRDPAVTLMWLDLLGLAHAALPAAADGDAAAAAADAAGRALGDVARPRLRALRKRCAREAERFAAMDDEARHALRRRLKRLRYGIDFAAALFPARGIAREAAALRAAQDALGDFNDLCVAETLCRAAVPPGPGAWFALGWLAARRPVVEAHCARRLAAWAQTTPFWKK